MTIKQNILFVEHVMQYLMNWSFNVEMNGLNPHNYNLHIYV